MPIIREQITLCRPRLFCWTLSSDNDLNQLNKASLFIHSFTALLGWPWKKKPLPLPAKLLPGCVTAKWMKTGQTGAFKNSQRRSRRVSETNCSRTASVAVIYKLSLYSLHPTRDQLLLLLPRSHFCLHMSASRRQDVRSAAAAAPTFSLYHLLQTDHPPSFSIILLSWANQLKKKHASHKYVTLLSLESCSRVSLHLAAAAQCAGMGGPPSWRRTETWIWC